jgi:hypothetical protein
MNRTNNNNSSTDFSLLTPWSENLQAPINKKEEAPKVEIPFQSVVDTKDFLCPIGQIIMKMPVFMDTCGHTFEEETLLAWFKNKGKKICPLCNEERSSVTTNLFLKNAIEKWSKVAKLEEEEEEGELVEEKDELEVGQIAQAEEKKDQTLPIQLEDGEDAVALQPKVEKNVSLQVPETKKKFIREELKTKLKEIWGIFNSGEEGRGVAIGMLLNLQEEYPNEKVFSVATEHLLKKKPSVNQNFTNLQPSLFHPLPPQNNFPTPKFNAPMKNSSFPIPTHQLLTTNSSFGQPKPATPWLSRQEVIEKGFAEKEEKSVIKDQHKSEIHANGINHDKQSEDIYQRYLKGEISKETAMGQLQGLLSIFHGQERNRLLALIFKLKASPNGYKRFQCPSPLNPGNSQSSLAPNVKDLSNLQTQKSPNDEIEKHIEYVYQIYDEKKISKTIAINTITKLIAKYKGNKDISLWKERLNKLKEASTNLQVPKRPFVPHQNLQGSFIPMQPSFISGENNPLKRKGEGSEEKNAQPTNLGSNNINNWQTQSSNKGVLDLASQMKRQRTDKTIFDFAKNGGFKSFKLALTDDNVNRKDENGNSLLHIVVLAKRKVKFVEALREKNVDINGINSEGNTPLHLAVEQKVMRIIKKLCESGADTNIKNHNGKSPKEVRSNLKIQKYFQEREALDQMKDDLEKLMDVEILMDEKST